MTIENKPLAELLNAERWELIEYIRQLEERLKFTTEVARLERETANQIAEAAFSDSDQLDKIHEILLGKVADPEPEPDAGIDECEPAYA